MRRRDAAYCGVSTYPEREFCPVLGLSTEHVEKSTLRFGSEGMGHWAQSQEREKNSWCKIDIRRSMIVVYGNEIPLILYRIGKLQSTSSIRTLELDGLLGLIDNPASLPSASKPSGAVTRPSKEETPRRFFDRKASKFSMITVV